MSLVRTIVATVVATSTLFVGVLETALADAAPPGVVRTQPRTLDATGCVKSTAEADAEADDAHDGLRDDGAAACVTWSAHGIDAGTRADLLSAAGPRVVRPLRITNLVRGPPARG